MPPVPKTPGVLAFAVPPCGAYKHGMSRLSSRIVHGLLSHGRRWKAQRVARPGKSPKTSQPNRFKLESKAEDALESGWKQCVRSYMYVT